MHSNARGASRDKQSGDNDIVVRDSDLECRRGPLRSPLLINLCSELTKDLEKCAKSAILICGQCNCSVRGTAVNKSGGDNWSQARNSGIQEFVSEEDDDSFGSLFTHVSQRRHPRSESIGYL